MKINKQIIAVAALAFCAYNAQAFKYQLAISSTTDPLGTGPDQSVYLPGATGQTDFNFALVGGSSSALWAGTTVSGTAYSSLVSSPAGAFSSVTVDPATDLVTGPGQTYSVNGNGGDGYDEVVNWTISPTAINEVGSITFSFAVITPSQAGSTNPNTKLLGAQTLQVDIVPTVTVPEPAQTVAGAMLLGCGGLVFAGRRLFKKQTA
jgi:hypothetical protein